MVTNQPRGMFIRLNMVTDQLFMYHNSIEQEDASEASNLEIDEHDDVVLSRVNVVDVVKDEHVNYEFSVPELDQSFGPRVRILFLDLVCAMR